ncbi:Zn-dependent metalloprotease [Nocardioides daedukensis]|uniref:Neutral metalloproteinase n=1 Tax=Nocardioides daedukensis TaxID=634462 RepID=A0A7Y9S3M9_9ACTN|nr:M4 family metallopeptidase [Nocardioides daedukensis]NYG59957.1 Zn-dependent metalloprotease [Nocardioides daedukensis]
MSQNPLSRRRRILVATTTIALLGLAQTAHADDHGDDVKPPQRDSQSSNQAKTRNSAKQISPAERRQLVSEAKSKQSATAKQLKLPSAQGLVAKDVQVDGGGAQHTRYDRTYKGLRVLGGDVLVHTDDKGAVADVQHASRKDVRVASTKARISKKTAELAGARAADYPVRSKKAELIVFAGKDGDVLAWDTVVKGIRKDQTPSRMHVIVDATTGKALAQWDEIHNASGEGIFVGTVQIDTKAVSGGYEMTDTVRGNGTTIDMNNAQSGGSVMTDSDNAWGDGTMGDPHSAGVDAHYGAAQTWDYFLDRHDRHGIFDDGQGVPSRVHYGNNYVNAFWDGQQMTYGDGENNQNPLTELDVAGHEMSHGVTEATAGLVYYGDAGGLNESTSDIFGTSVEFNAGNADDVGDYLVGEEIDINGNGTPLRYMDKPSRDGSSYDCWTSSMGSADPHYTSGPGNHFFYLASEGSGAKTINGVDYNSPTCDSSTVEGIGRASVEQIWYRALSTYMTSTTTYPEARDATVRAAVDLYGAESAECAGIESAWDGVAVPQNDFTCTNSGGTDPEEPPTGACEDLSSTESGRLARSGSYGYEPGSQGYYTSSASGTHAACIDGPAGTDFDLYLEKWNGTAWTRVAASTSSGSHEEIRYDGSSGSYSYVVQSYSGSGSYTMRFSKP